MHIRNLIRGERATETQYPIIPNNPACRPANPSHLLFPQVDTTCRAHTARGLLVPPYTKLFRELELSVYYRGISEAVE